MKHRPHQGKLRRNFHIFRLYDSGEYSPQEIASQITAMGYRCTRGVVRYVLRSRQHYREFYAEQFQPNWTHPNT
jgi:hypothetical protein